MESLPITLLKLIDSYLGMFDHLALTEVCKKTNRLKIDYHSSLKNYLKENYQVDLRFLKYLFQYKKFIDINVLRTGNIECVRWLISSGMNFNWNDGLYYACRGGNIEIVHLVMSKGTYEWNGGLYGACLNNHTKIAQLMIQHGATLCVQCYGKKHQF